MSTAFAPGSPEWARLVTASKVAGILGISPWDSQYKVWCVMAGLIPPDPENEAMRRGNMLEDAILNWWLADHPAAIELGRQVTCQIPDEPWAAATPDMIVYSAADVDSPIEIVDAKTSSDDEDWGRPGTDEAPKYYIASSMWQLAMHPVAERVRLAVLFGRPFTLREYVIERDDDLCGALIDRCRAFHETVASGVMPPLDDSVATYEAVRAQHPDIDRDLDVQITEAQASDWLASKAAVESADRWHRGATTALLDQMGKARRAMCDGSVIARRQPHASGSVSLVRVAPLPQPATDQGDAA